MKGNEIISNILNNNFNTEIPFTLINSLYGGKFINDSIENYYKIPELYLEGQTKLYDKLQTDVIFAPFALSLFTTPFNGEIKYFSNQTPTICKHAIDSSCDFSTLKVPNPLNYKEIKYILKSLKLLKESFKNEAPICATIPSPIDLPLILMGFDKWLEIFLFDPHKRDIILEITSQFFNIIIDELFSNGADILAIGVPFSSSYFMTKEIIEKHTAPIYKKYLNQIKYPFILHHGGQPIINSLDFLKGIDSALGFYLDSRDSISKARLKLGPDRLLLGNIDGVSLYKIKEETLNIKIDMLLKNCGEDQKFIFGTSQGDIPLSTDINKLIRMRNRIKGYKRSND
jgi:uroporphyrinogen-III decarboxylase